MAKVISTESLEAIGLRHWTKNSMDRIYINMDPDAEYDRRYLKCFFNRYQWMNLKVYWDVPTCQLVISTGSDDAKAAVTAVVTDMVNGTVKKFQYQ